MRQKNGTKISTVEGLKSHLESGGFVRLPDGVYFFRKSDGFFELTDSTLLADSWVEAPRTFEELFASGYTVACDDTDFLPERRGAIGAGVSTNEVPPKWRMPNGHVFATGDMLRAHLNAGGFVQTFVDCEKWYRSRANKQEWLGEKSSQWEATAWDWDDLARMNVCRACDEPQLSKDIRAREEADAERERQREEDNEQVRRDVGAPPVMKKINPCRCDGCERTKNGVSVFYTQFTPHGMVAIIAAHGGILLQLVPVDKVIELRDEINRWLDGAA